MDSSGKNEEDPVVRMWKKIARSEDSDNSRDLNVRLNMIKGRSLVKYREVNGFPGIYARESWQASKWVAVKPRPISLQTRTIN